MSKRFAIVLDFILTFARYALHIRETIASLVLLIVLSGLVISKVENIDVIDSFYFAFITALSVGYGDIHPSTTVGKLLSVGIGLIGMLFVGLTVAVANRALADTAKRHLTTEK